MTSETGKHLEALSHEEYDYFKDVAEAFRDGSPVQKDISSQASKDLQELLIKINGLLLPKPEVFVNIYSIMIHKEPAQTMRYARVASELYKKFGMPAKKIDEIFSASSKNVNGVEEVFCGRPVYEGKGEPGYCPIKLVNVSPSARVNALHRYWGEQGLGVWETKSGVRRINEDFDETHPEKTNSKKCKGCIYYNTIYVDSLDDF